MSITAEFDAQTAVERELVLRLASLLWRLRRAIAIETGSLQIQSDIIRDAPPQQLEPVELHKQGCDPGLRLIVSTSAIRQAAHVERTWRGGCVIGPRNNGEDDKSRTAKMPQTARPS